MAEFRINVTVDPTKAEAGAKRVRGALDRTTKNADRLRATLVRAFAVLGGAAIGTAAIRAIRDYDTALIGVGKTTGILGPQLEALGRNVNAISRTVPVAVGELLEIAQAAGQLGIQGSANIEKFTRTVAQLGIASNLRGSEAATTLARFLSVTQTEVGSVDRLGSVIVRLGNNFAATEREIALAATRIAQTTALFRPMAHEVAGLATAVRALGLRAELASTAISRSFIQIDQTIRGGGQGLQDLAEITRTSADALGGLFANDPTEVFVRFLEGLSRVEAGGGDVVATLEKFNITGIESTQVLGTLATRTDLVRDALRQAGDEWQRNTALTDEANTAATSLGARFQFLASAVTDIFLALGESGGENIIGASVDALTAAARAIADNIDLALDAAVAFTAALAVPKIAAITASLAGAGAAAGTISAGLTAAAAAARVLGRALLIGFAIEAITVVVEELQELNDAISRTPATWADAATVAADRFANNLVGGLVAVARGINNTIRLITDPIIAAFREAGRIAGEQFKIEIPAPELPDLSFGFSLPTSAEIKTAVANATKDVIAFVETQFDLPTFAEIRERVEGLFDFDLPTIVLPDISLPSFSEVVARIERFFEDIELPTLHLPDISLPSLGEIRDRIISFLDDVDLPALHLPDISLPSLGEIRDRIARFLDDIELPTLHIPDFSLPSLGEIRDRIASFLDGIDLPMLHIPDISLPSLGEIRDRIAGFLDGIDLPMLHIPDFSLPSLAEVRDRIANFLEDVDLPTLHLPDISLPSLGAIRDRIARFLEDVELPTLHIPDFSLPSLGEVRDRVASFLDDVDLPTLHLPDISLPSLSDIRGRIERFLDDIELPTLHIPDFSLPRLGEVRDQIANFLEDVDLPTLHLPDISLPSLGEIRNRIERFLEDDIELPTLHIPDISLPQTERDRGADRELPRRRAAADAPSPGYQLAQLGRGARPDRSDSWTISSSQRCTCRISRFRASANFGTGSPASWTISSCPRLHLPDISLPSLGEIVADIETAFDNIDLPSIQLPDIGLPAFADIADRIERAFSDIELPTLLLPDISLPNVDDLAARLERTFADVDLPTISLPDISIPDVNDVVAEIERAFDDIELPTLLLPDFSLPTAIDLQAGIARILSGLGLIPIGTEIEFPSLAGIRASLAEVLEGVAGLIGIDFEFPTLAEIQQRIERFFDGLRLPSLNLFGGSTDDDAEQEAGRAIDIWEGVGGAIRETESEIEKFERRFGTLEGVMSRTLPRIQDVGVQVAGLGDSFRIAIDALTPSADALTATVDIWEGLADTAPPEGALERIVSAADAAFVEALARVGTDFAEDLNRRYIPIASPEQLAAFERQQDDLVTKTKETAAAIREAAAGGAGAAVERATELSADQLKSLERLRDAYDPSGGRSERVRKGPGAYCRCSCDGKHRASGSCPTVRRSGDRVRSLARSAQCADRRIQSRYQPARCSHRPAGRCEPAPPRTSKPSAPPAWTLPPIKPPRLCASRSKHSRMRRTRSSGRGRRIRASRTRSGNTSKTSKP